jgi:nucleoside phosphorylase
MSRRRPLRRLGVPAVDAAGHGPSIQNTPSLPPIDFVELGKSAPALPPNPPALPLADTVILCWAEAEWAAVQHVFVSGSQAMPYSAAATSAWPEWSKLTTPGVPAGIDGGYWGYYRLVTVGTTRVLLFKSNVHLDETNGQANLVRLVELFATNVKPTLILSTGTAGGARTADPIGTVNVVDIGTLLENGDAASSPSYGNGWRPAWQLVQSASFNQQLVGIPTTPTDLQSLARQFNEKYGTSYTLTDLDPNNLCSGAPVPSVNDLTPGTSLLTTNNFAVGNTGGNFAQFACIEMDDAVIGEACKNAGIAFGFVRNISDPIQNAALPSQDQGHWGELVYEAYGFYTSYNGALVAWGILS